MKRKWLLAIVAVGILAAGLGVGAVFASGGLSDGDGDGDSPESTFMSKVASILELDEDTVSDAFEQARSEMADERVEAMLDAKVEKGLITQDQADEYLEWFQDRPDDIFPMFKRGGHGGWKHGKGFGLYRKGKSSYFDKDQGASAE